MRLTLAGEAYSSEIRGALRRISTATLGFRANPQGGTLNLAMLPTFGTRWLAPRLPAFIATNPGITTNLTTWLVPFDFQAELVDAAIHFGQPDWSGAHLELLMNETVIPACSRKLLGKYRFRQPADLMNAPLLHLVSRPDAWERWFRAMDVHVDDNVHGMLVDQFAMAAQAAISGLGVALLPRFLIGDELARGDLVEAMDGPVESAESYYLAWPPARENYPPLRAFREWIRAEAIR